ncbi:MAG: hypothetical protein Q9227_003285 [Pyrenula ochraceoflavens]
MSRGIFDSGTIKLQSASSSRAGDPCGCASSLLQAISKIPQQQQQQQNAQLGFDAVLNFGAEVSEKCKIMLTCEHCCTQWHAVQTVQNALDLSLAYLEGACATYAIIAEADSRFPDQQLQQLPDFKTKSMSMPMSGVVSSALLRNDDHIHHRNGGAAAISSTEPEHQGGSLSASEPGTVCSASPMTWGEYELEGDNAQLLAHVVLRQGLTDLAALIAELQFVLENVWFRNHAQQPESMVVQECKGNVAGLMDRLVLLVGLLE